MVQINGHYQLVKNENFVEYLEALGAPIDMIRKVTGPDITTEIVQEKNKITIKSKGANVVLILDEEVDEVLPTGIPIRNFATRKGDVITVVSTAADNRKRSRLYEFTDEGYTVTLMVGDLVAKRYFVRT
ncbi:hypothetical protein RN001_005187 [Aquatica leii]|uniref:Uncharacterized protein n=1 Tax=Aquatica leii TaxID=1421715 RepID=A0AAN7QK33_9COLE|nr:hypothetical protein RN001_005187 [Aquatica leii]